MTFAQAVPATDPGVARGVAVQGEANGMLA